MEKSRIIVRLALALFLPLTASQAWAYFSGVTPSDGIELKSSPAPSSPTVKILPKGTAFNAADTPTNGFYRIRTATDTGWVSGVGIGKANPKPAPPRQRPRPVRAQKRRRPAPVPVHRHFEVKGLLNLNLTNNGDLNSAIGATDFNSEVGFGAELIWFFNRSWGAGLRIEHLGKEVLGTDELQHDLTFKQTSTPVMVGLTYLITEPERRFQLSASGFAGLASTSLTSSDNTAGSSGSYSATPLTFLAKLEGGYNFGKSFGLFAEAGYRGLSTSSITASGNPTPLPASLKLNLSGPVLGVGAVLRF